MTFTSFNRNLLKKYGQNLLSLQKPISSSASIGLLNKSGANDTALSSSPFFFSKFEKYPQFLFCLKSLQTDIESFGLNFNFNKVSFKHISFLPLIDNPFNLTEGLFIAIS